MDITTLIRDIPDYPKPGINFKDITPLLKDPSGLAMAVDGRDLIGRDEGWSVVLAADVSYAEDLAQRVGPWLTGLSRRGAEVYLAEPRRGFLTPPGPPLAEYLTPDDADPTGALCRRTPVWRL